MVREDFRIVKKFYATSTLTMIFYGKVIIESVEMYKNYSAFENATDKAERLADIKKQTDSNQKLIDAGKEPKPIKVKQVKMKTKKDDRTELEISNECESLIKKYIEKNQ